MYVGAHMLTSKLQFEFIQTFQENHFNYANVPNRFGSINTVINCCIASQQTEATCMVVCGKEEDYQDPFCNKRGDKVPTHGA